MEICFPFFPSGLAGLILAARLSCKQFDNGEKECFSACAVPPGCRIPGYKQWPFRKIYHSLRPSCCQKKIRKVRLYLCPMPNNDMDLLLLEYTLFSQIIVKSQNQLLIESERLCDSYIFHLQICQAIVIHELYDSQLTGQFCRNVFRQMNTKKNHISLFLNRYAYFWY